MLKPQEAAIADAWDAGMSMERIAREKRLPLRRVRTTVSYLSEGNETRTANEDAIRGSAMLAAAIERMLAKRARMLAERSAA